ncbi:related to 6-hydroxy-d-nicotine oxidase [Ramularia collo-cygni]|uniref:Related to 6-hydroxy-d-nicotine oxidase n=1 Tax=Ramularia collo-cygni TaxID=112498 RepID=A0A2D3UW13_9PEZI|nr:related to 6-hydroxy-d-nicotine oxidase [Ramularia collo-cygni]CZT16357.1 related to 6-hydroxy-d-nicotine oxidase [Ramularia collo-cygni]
MAFPAMMAAFLLLLLGASASSQLTDAVNSCCLGLYEKYGEQQQLLIPESAQYDAFDERWATNTPLLPSCIFLPISADDIAAALYMLRTGAGSGNSTCPFAIKSGGHAPWPGANDIHDGITIDLSWINRTVLAEDRSSVRLGSGALWSDAYDSLNGTGIAFTGGRIPGVGVGGLTLGGGYSFFSPTHGFVADNVLNYEIVLASGEITNANKTHRSDLFMALKGGSSNFGIVTTFDILAFENADVYRGILIYPIDSTCTVLNSIAWFTENNKDDPDSSMSIEFSFKTGSNDTHILADISDTKDLDNHPALLPFLSIVPRVTKSLGVEPIAGFAPHHDIAPAYRSLMSTVTFVQNSTRNSNILEGVHDITLDTFHKYSHVPDLEWKFVYTPIPRFYSDHSTKLGGNMMGLNNTKENLIMVRLNPHWKDADYDGEIYEAAQVWLAAVQDYTNALGMSHPFVFLNNAAPFQDPLGSYGAENLQFMRDVSKKYDPDQIFQTLVPGGFKLSKAGAGSQRL